MSFDLLARLKLQDEMTNKLKRISGEAGRTQKSIGGMTTGIKKFVSTTASISAAIGLTKAVSAGFNMVRDSIGSALDRIDTMESFDRVLLTLTGSAEKTAEALEFTRDAVTGTAYGMDVAAKGVQDFVTRGMEVEKATSTIAAWGDAVAFYGDGSNDQLASVSDALAKMVSSGKVGMDQMNRLYDAGIDGTGMYAKAVGKTEEDVKKALSSGEISAEQFIDTVSTAMMEGTNGVHKIAGAAKDAGASWGASMDNMRAAVTRGVVSIVEKIDEMLEDNGLPQMRDMIANFGSAFEDALNKVASSIPAIADKIKIIYDGVVKWFPIVKEMVIGAGVAFLAFKGIMMGMTVIGTVTRLLEALRLGTLKATLAQMGFNTTLLLNPFTLVVAGIASLIAVGVLLYRNWDTIKDKTIELWDSLVGLKDKGVALLTDKFGGLIDNLRNFKDAVIDVKDNAVQLISDKLSDFKGFIEENQTAILVATSILGAVFGPALITAGGQAVITGLKIAGGLTLNFLRAATMAIYMRGILVAQAVSAFVRTGAQAIISGAQISVNFIGSLIRTSAQAISTSAVLTGRLILSMSKVSTQALKTSATITASVVASLVRFAAQGWLTVASIAATTAAWVIQRGVMSSSAIVYGAITAAQWALNVAMNANPIGLIIVGIASLVGIGIVLWKNFDKIKNKAVELWNGMGNIKYAILTLLGPIGAVIGAGIAIYKNWDVIKEKAIELVAVVTGVFGSIGSWFVDRWNDVKKGTISAIKAIGETVSKGFENVKNWVIDKIKSMKDAVVWAFTELPILLAYQLGYIVGTIVKWVSKIPPLFKEYFIKAVDAVVWVFTDLPKIIGEWLGNAWNTSVEWLSDIATSFGHWFMQAIDNSIEFLIELPAKIGEWLSVAWDTSVEWLMSIAESFGEWFMNAVDKTIDVLINLPETIAGLLLLAWNTSVEWLSNIASAFGTWFSTAVSNAVTFVSELPGKIGSYLANAYDKSIEWLSNIAGSFKEWFTTAYENAIDIIKKIPGAIAGFIAEIPEKIAGVIGTVKDKFKELGRAIPKAIASGFNAAFKGIGKAAKWAIDKVVGGVTSLANIGKEAAESFGSGYEDAQSTDGSNFHGLKRVPYDGYISELHRGERVLSRQEADVYERLRQFDVSNVIEFPTDRVSDSGVNNYDNSNAVSHITYGGTENNETVNEINYATTNNGESGKDTDDDRRIVVEISGNEFNVREDGDIEKVAYKLAKLIDEEGSRVS